MKTIDKFIKEAHDNAVKHGFYQEKREIGTFLISLSDRCLKND